MSFAPHSDPSRGSERPLPASAAARATRERILDVAEALFAERGFAGASMREIAARAGLAAASLYNHFSGKDALYAAVLERGIRPLIDLMEGMSQKGHSPEAVDALICAVMHHLGRRPHLPRLVYHEAVAGGAHLARLAGQWVRPLVERGLDAMEHAPGSYWDEELRPLVISAWIHLVVGHFAMAPLLREVLGRDPFDPDMLELQTRFLRRLATLQQAGTDPSHLTDD